MKSILDKIKHLISRKINEENDRHADLLYYIKETIDLKYDENLFNKVNLVHDTRIKLLEEILEELKNI